MNNNHLFYDNDFSALHSVSLSSLFEAFNDSKQTPWAC